MMSNTNKYSVTLLIIIISFVIGGYSSLAIRDYANREIKEHSDVIGKTIVVNNTKFNVVSISCREKLCTGDLINGNYTLQLPVKQIRMLVNISKE